MKPEARVFEIVRPLGKYYRNISLAAHPHASYLTHWQTRPQLYFNSVTFIWPKLLLWFDFHRTVVQIENMRIAFWNFCLDVCFLNSWLLNTGLDFKTTKPEKHVYHCLTPQFWNLGHVKISPLFLGTPWICESHVPSLPENTTYKAVDNSQRHWQGNQHLWRPFLCCLFSQIINVTICED